MASIHQTRPGIDCAASLGPRQRHVRGGVLSNGTWQLLRPDNAGFHFMRWFAGSTGGLVYYR